MLPNQTQLNTIEEYFCSVLERYATMERNGVDTVGLHRLIKMLEHYQEHGTITPGEFQYLFDRTHPLGKFKQYNIKGRQYGLMLQCPVELLATFAVDWRIPSNPLRKDLTLKFPQFPDWYNNSSHRSGPQQPKLVLDLFK
jgi:hypothetical protein